VAVLVTVLAVVVALLAVLVAGLLRSHAEILRSLHGLGVDLDPARDVPGEARPTTTSASASSLRASEARDTPVASDIVGETPAGDAASIAVTGTEHSTLLAFLTSGCTTCAGFWTAFARDDLQVPGDARLVVVTKGADGESPARLRRFVPPGVPVVMSSEAWKRYDVPVAPFFAFVDGASGQIVGEGAAASWDHLSSMMEQAIADAGITTTRRRRRRRLDGAAREARVDERLRAAGIEPGDASLYPQQASDLVDPDDVP
jgi:hypothetical protein